MESGNPAEQFVDDEVPPDRRHLIPSAIRRAYAAADRTMAQSPYFGTPGGKYQRGDLIMLAASYEFEVLVKEQALPFDGIWEFFARPTGKHYVMLTPRSRITTSQIDDPRKRPRRAVFRANYAELNDKFLFDYMNAAAERQAEEAKRDGERRLIHILHGYQELQFVHLAYPHPGRNGHIYRSSNLLKMPHEVTSDLPPEEGPADSPNPEALDKLNRHLREDD
jgi:hypothetical protein